MTWQCLVSSCTFTSDRMTMSTHVQERNFPQIVGVVIGLLGPFFQCNTHRANVNFLNVGVGATTPFIKKITHGPMRCYDMGPRWACVASCYMEIYMLR